MEILVRCYRYVLLCRVVDFHNVNLELTLETVHKKCINCINMRREALLV
jgi:hypothetical protein